ncbi:MAG: DHHA1 domain-containing protein [Sulfolobales archaeon]
MAEEMVSGESGVSRERVKSFIATHTDADGVGALANLIRILGIESYERRYIEPDELYSTMRSLVRDVRSGRVENIYILDLAPNRGDIERLAELIKSYKDFGARIFWYDHHVWDDKWFSILRESGAEIYHDRSTCATGVVRRFLGSTDLFTIDLEKTICSIDLWLFSDPRSPWIARLVSYRRDDSWRDLLVSMFIRARDVDEVIEWGARYVEESIDRELREYDYYVRKSIILPVDSISIVYALKKSSSIIGVSILAHYLLSYYDSDIAVIIRPNGSISFRSREYNVREIAAVLGGGGHPRASGARVYLSILDKILLRLGFEKIVIIKIARIIERVIRDLMARNINLRIQI